MLYTENCIVTKEMNFINMECIISKLHLRKIIYYVYLNLEIFLNIHL